MCVSILIQHNKSLARMAHSAQLYISIMQAFHWNNYQLISIDIGTYLPGAILDILNDSY